MSIKIHVLHTGDVCVSPDLPFGGENFTKKKFFGIFTPKHKRIWLPVFSYYIEHPKGKILIDTGWHRNMSPDGVFDKSAQIKSLGSRLLYMINQGVIQNGKAIHEQLQALGVQPSELDYVILTHLDCDHVSGLEHVKDAKKILVSADELQCAKKHSFVRYQKKWWDKINITEFDWNDALGPSNKSYDLFRDRSVELIAIPGHTDGMFAVKITNSEKKYVLFVSDGAYSYKSWQNMLLSGIALNRTEQRLSLEWIKAQSENPYCIKIFATHDKSVEPGKFEF
ncbi:hypothetical protein LMG7974_00575 [Campylobacter majalis]|uniref:Metallo-beta-lactamase domain-containing protein n=1 Tax=Campylobacter majalis TaxID=2790656 RepID=A0ABN7K9Z5_9BACT|nr:N-acyl homoserine lactonase family protein [Campylobacter majalis]CAD7287695.1 hypothetical protein LMG7974_00575 [Campylobacter majalis]